MFTSLFSDDDEIEIAVPGLDPRQALDRHHVGVEVELQWHKRNQDTSISIRTVNHFLNWEWFQKKTHQ